MTKHTILFLAANPSGTDPRALDRQASSIAEELSRSGSRDQLELVTRWAVEPLDLLRELRKLRPAVVHFSGHGNQGILKYRPDLTQLSLGVLVGLILLVVIILFFDGLKKNDLSWKGLIGYPLGIIVLALLSVDCLHHGLRSRACARCDLVLEHHPLRFDSLSAATSTASTGDVQELTQLAQRGATISSSNLWLCQGCQEVGIIELPRLQRVLRGGGLEQLANKIRPAPP